MDQTELRGVLATLHADLGRESAVDAESRTLLLQLLTDIDRLLSVPTPKAASNAPGAGQLDRLRDMEAGLEAKHPVLAATIREVIDMLTRMGL
jgi:predicted component of type VI protein secretion system